MEHRLDERDNEPRKPDVDANGVDRAQIRAMLALTPEDRLRRIEDFLASVMEIKERNGARPPL